MNQAKYIAHLDLARVFDRAMRRAGIQVAFSEGFNPHPKIAFGAPLPVGVEGEREYVDVKLKEDIFSEKLSDLDISKSIEQIVNCLQVQLPEGIKIVDYIFSTEKVKPLMSVINLLCYSIEVPMTEPISDVNFKNAIANWLSRDEIFITRKGKSKLVRKNLRPFVYRLEVISQEKMELVNLFKMKMNIIITGEGTIRPSEVMASIKELENIPIDFDGVAVTRNELYIMNQDEVVNPLKYEDNKVRA